MTSESLLAMLAGAYFEIIAAPLTCSVSNWKLYYFNSDVSYVVSLKYLYSPVPFCFSLLGNSTF